MFSLVKNVNETRIYNGTFFSMDNIGNGLIAHHFHVLRIYFLLLLCSDYVVINTRSLLLGTLTCSFSRDWSQGVTYRL